MNKRKIQDLSSSEPQTTKIDEHVMVSNFGRVKLKNGRITAGVEDARGYLKCRVDGQVYSVHQLVLLTHGSIPESGLTVDHLDRDRKNNKLENLRWATWSEQALNRNQPSTISTGRKITISVTNLDGQPQTQIETENLREAASITGLSRNYIFRCCHGLAKGTGQYNFKFADAPIDLEDEVWQEISDDSGVSVSNCGRFKRKNGTVTYGTIDASGYRCVRFGGRTFKLHRLVALNFLSAPLNPNYTVDHIDRNKANNHVNNLRWASATEQTQNRTLILRESNATKRKVEYRKVGDEQWICCESLLDASNKLFVKKGAISAVCTKRAKSLHGYEFRYYDEPDISGEIWKNAVVFIR